jgi:hypothetical protein
MKTHLFLPALLAASIASAQPAAPDAAPAQPDNPPAAPAEAKTEMQKWIEATDAQWQAAFKRDVTDAHAAEVNKAKLQYLTALEDGIKKASSAGDLKGAVALRDEQKRFGDTGEGRGRRRACSESHPRRHPCTACEGGAEQRRARKGAPREV